MLRVGPQCWVQRAWLPRPPLKAVGTQLKAAERRIDDLAQDTEASYYAGQENRLADIADHYVAHARDLSGKVMLTDEPPERAELAQESLNALDGAMQQVDEVLGDLDSMQSTLRPSR